MDKQAFPLRLDPDVYDAQRWAAAELRSVNGQIEYLLRCALQDSGRLARSNSASQETTSAKRKRTR
jgi:hypothetical protein